jgi:CheY-like chemotaxis protein
VGQVESRLAVAGLGQKPRRILVADDDSSFTEVMAEILADAGHAAQLSARGDEALALALADPPDMILLDIRLPGLDGLRVAELLSLDARTCNVPLFLTTLVAPHERASWQDLLADRGWHILFKPFSLVELLEAIRQSLPMVG